MQKDLTYPQARTFSSAEGMLLRNAFVSGEMYCHQPPGLGMTSDSPTHPFILSLTTSQTRYLKLIAKANTGLGLKALARVGEFCFCSCLPIPPELACIIHATWPKPFSRALYYCLNTYFALSLFTTECNRHDTFLDHIPLIGHKQQEVPQFNHRQYDIS